MKIAATASGSSQVSQDQYRYWHITKVFDSSASFDELTTWAISVLGANANWQSLLLSHVIEDPVLGIKEPKQTK